MPRIACRKVPPVHCIVDDFLLPWDVSTPVLMTHVFAPQRGVLEPLGAGDRRNPSGLPPRPARLRPLGSTPGRVSLYARDNRRADPGGARRLVVAAGALGRRFLRRDLRSPARRGTSRPHRQLGAVQHTDANSRSYQAYLRAGSRHASDAMRAFGVGEWCRQTLGYRLDTERAKRCADGSCTRWTGRSPGLSHMPKVLTRKPLPTRGRDWNRVHMQSPRTQLTPR